MVVAVFSLSMVSSRELNQVISGRLYVQIFVYVIKQKHLNCIVSVHERTLNSGLTVVIFIPSFSFSDNILAYNLKFS